MPRTTHYGTNTKIRDCSHSTNRLERNVCSEQGTYLHSVTVNAERIAIWMLDDQKQGRVNGGTNYYSLEVTECLDELVIVSDCNGKNNVTCSVLMCLCVCIYLYIYTRRHTPNTVGKLSSDDHSRICLRISTFLSRNERWRPFTVQTHGPLLVSSTLF
jgi:hypothetical protein